MTEFIMEKIALPCIALMTLGVAVFLFVYLPVLVHAEKRCLQAGYPETRITYDFERFCMNLEGTVTIRVDKLER